MTIQYIAKPGQFPHPYTPESGYDKFYYPIWVIDVLCAIVHEDEMDWVKWFMARAGVWSIYGLLVI